MPSRPLIELTNIGSAGIVAPLAVPGTWSPTFVQANRVLLDGGDIPVAPAVTDHTIEVMGPNYILYEALGTATFILDLILIFIHLTNHSPYSSCLSSIQILFDYTSRLRFHDLSTPITPQLH
ncbi:hypothetical protein N7536_005867 [Penicillium majusculum]|nr:hypothetical protein N7536_005867 [Penicillium majusculum]